MVAANKQRGGKKTTNGGGELISPAGG